MSGIVYSLPKFVQLSDLRGFSTVHFVCQVMHCIYMSTFIFFVTRILNCEGLQP